MKMEYKDHAIIHPEAQIGKDVIIGPFSYIDKNVIIGDGSRIGPHVTIYSGARIGKKVQIHPGAVIAGIPQDLKFNGEVTTAEIGDNTIVREYVTINRGTSYAKRTSVGKNCLLMAYSHLAHDCILHREGLTSLLYTTWPTSCINTISHVNHPPTLFTTAALTSSMSL